MSLDSIAIFIGAIALLFAGIGLAYEHSFRARILNFSRNIFLGRVLALLCCILAAREAYLMNMGGLNQYKHIIFYIAPIVFFCACIYMKELLAARALGGILCLVSVPIVKVASLSGVNYFQAISLLCYLWVLIGMTLLLSPWQFRKISKRLMQGSKQYRAFMCTHIFLGIILITLGIFIY